MCSKKSLIFFYAPKKAMSAAEKIVKRGGIAVCRGLAAEKPFQVGSDLPGVELAGGTL
jgi:hypothetical protein